MMPDLSVDDILTTTRSVRKRLDFSRPVSRQVLLECLELAIQAPTAAHARAASGCSSAAPTRRRHSAMFTARSSTPINNCPNPTAPKKIRPPNTKTRRSPRRSIWPRTYTRREHLIAEFDWLAEQRGTYPAALRCDNGPELACSAMADWAAGKVGLHFIPPGEPWRNGYVESFNARVRDECLILRT